MRGHVARTYSFRQPHQLRGCVKSLPFKEARVTVATFCQYSSWMLQQPVGQGTNLTACSPFSTPQRGWFVIGGITTTTHHYSVTSCTGCRFLSMSNWRSVGSCLSHFCITNVSGHIPPHQGCDSNRWRYAIFMRVGWGPILETAPSRPLTQMLERRSSSCHSSCWLGEQY